jgi:Uma2 family endonuclease
VPEYWIIDVKGRAVEVLTDPVPAGYRRCAVLGAKDTLRPLNVPGVSLRVAELWRPPRNERR